MKKSLYKGQIVRILRETDCDAIPRVLKRNGVSETSSKLAKARMKIKEVKPIYRLYKEIDVLKTIYGISKTYMRENRIRI